MGYIKHNAIVVTGSRWREPYHPGEATEIDDAHAVATAIFPEGHVSEVLGPVTNSTFSFFVAPDGSKEGWDGSNEGDERRDEFVRWLDEANGEHGGWFEWVEVWYGNDDGDAGVVRHHDSASEKV